MEPSPPPSPQPKLPSYSAMRSEDAGPAPTVLKAGLIYKLGGSRRHLLPGAASKSLISWKPKRMKLYSDGSLAYRDCSADEGLSSSDSSSDSLPHALALLPGGVHDVAPLHARRLLDGLAGCDIVLPHAALFTLHAATSAGPPRAMVFAAATPDDARRWRQSADAAAGPARPDAFFAGKSVLAVARALNYRPRPHAVSSARAAAAADASSVDVLRELCVPEMLREMLARRMVGEGVYAVGGLAEVTGLGVDVVERLVKASDKGVADAAGCMQALCARENSICAADGAGLGDLSRPMSEYFVCSSHNTYLSGDQVMSASTPLMYRYALEMGVRCVELDLWDSDEGPMITHGNTATSDVLLRDALITIAEYAFVASPYPLVLSLENHLSVEQQEQAAKQIRECLGDALHVVPQGPDALLSPEALKGKILVKAKMGKWGHLPADGGDSPTGSYDDEDSYDEDDSDDDDSESGRTDSTESTNSSSWRSKFHKLSFRARRRKHGEKSDSQDGSKEPEKKHHDVAKELADVTTFGGANRKAIMQLWSEGGVHPSDQKPSDIVSISESKIEGLYEKKLDSSLNTYNVRNLTRVYPKATRVDSSNYNPMPAWGAGCQVVALNYQSTDVGFWLNHGRFVVNDRCGYAPRKPISDAFADPKQPDGFAITGPGKLELNVLCASLIPRCVAAVRSMRDFSDPYVEVTLARRGENGEADMEVLKTEAVNCNGLCPSWGTSLSVSVVDPQVDMLLICVWDDDITSKDDMLGFFCAPVYTLRTGLKAVHLNAEDGSPLRIPGASWLPTVLCDVKWTPSS